jgi:rhamnulokinase
MSHHLAIDLGAGSGRAMLGRVERDGVTLDELHRFTCAPRESAGHLRWDSARLFDGIRVGVAAAHAAVAARGVPLDSVGVDAWGVDYGLVDENGRLLEEPVCYRDRRTDGLVGEVCAIVPRAEIFARTGIQFMQLNTLFQLFAHARAGLPPGTRRLLLTPDLCHRFLCGSDCSEYTIASTTQLLDHATRDWARDLFDRLGLPADIMPPIVSAGSTLGALKPEFLAPGARVRPSVVAPAAHDTGSAVAGTPLSPGWAFVSSGTWSLVGVERTEPLVTPLVEEARFTNEGGACGTIRFLSNVMGLWLLQSCQREWDDCPLPSLLDAVAALGGAPGEVVCPDAPRFFNPASMTRELVAAVREQRRPTSDDPVTLTKVVLDSLALRYASVVATIERLTGRAVEGVHVVGGGSQNEYLNQATANATGRPVLAGPVEATATGNVVVQAIATRTLSSLDEARDLLRRIVRPRRFEPRDRAAWAEAADRYREVERSALTTPR